MLNGIPEQKEKINSHPKSLYVIFLTEMWERFSFYGMRALLVLYLTKHLDKTDSEAGSIYGTYNALVYFTPLLGGYLADNFLGNRKSILIGALLMMFGHLSLAFESLYTLYLGLVLLIIGNGFFKPNMTSMLGRLYDDRPHLKDSGYMLFYVGVNLGALLGFVMCGYIGERYNWHYGFGLAGIGMLLGLIIFQLGKHTLGEIGIKPETKNIVSGQSNSENDYSRILIILFLAIFHTIFWLIYEQTGSSINLFTDRNVDREILGIDIPASVYQSINPILILILGPIISNFWTRRVTANKEISISAKFIISFIFVFLAFGILFMGVNLTIGKLSPLWLLVFYLFLTLGELHISPVGLSMVSQIAPKNKIGLIVGVWFLSISLAQYIAGFIGGRYIQFMSIAEFFLLLSLLSIFCALILLLNKYRLTSKIKEYS